MRDMKMQDWKMRHKPAGFCRGWKMRHKAAKGRKCRNGKSRKRKIWKAVCKIIICRYAYRMHELNNAAKDATFVSLVGYT